MASITNPNNIPAAVKADLKEVCAAIGPTILGDGWPAGVDPAAMTAAEVAQVFELITREFWRQQIQGHKAAVAAEVARQAAVDATTADPFG